MSAKPSGDSAFYEAKFHDPDGVVVGASK